MDVYRCLWRQTCTYFASCICMGFIFVACKSVSCSHRDSFEEELHVVRLPNGEVLGNFRFEVLRYQTDLHYEMFPKIIGELLQAYGLDEFHLSLTQGFWHLDKWGFAPAPSTPPGAQVWAWFNQSVASVDINWRNFIHALSGLFCASLVQIDPSLTVSPEFSFRREGSSTLSGEYNADSRRVRYAALPSENVCTENLTPWKKLLPCKMESGISHLLSPLRLYSERYHSTSVDVKRIVMDSSAEETPYNNTAWQLLLTASVILDSSYIGNKNGTGLQDGWIVSRLTNNAERNFTVTYSHVIPWYLRVYFHSLQILCQITADDVHGEFTIEPLFVSSSPSKARKRPNLLELAVVLPPVSICFLRIYFERSLLRWTEYPPDAHRGFFVPSPSVTFAHTHDHNQTLFLRNESTLRRLLMAGQQRRSQSYFTRFFGEVLLINLPTPDFSMPYNVICLVCTVVALAFGPIHTLTTKTFTVVPANEKQSSAMSRLMDKVKSKFFSSSDVGAESSNDISKQTARKSFLCRLLERFRTKSPPPEIIEHG